MSNWYGETPTGWTVTKVSNLYEITLGKMLQPSKEEDDDILKPYICAANLGNDTFNLSDLKQMWFSPKETERLSLKRGDLLVVEGGDVASSAIVDFDCPDVYFQNSIMRTRPKSNLPNDFLHYFLMFVRHCGYLDVICNKATISHFTKEKFSNLPLLVPPIDEQNEIVEVLKSKEEKINALIANEERQIEKLKEYKQALISETVTKGLDPDVPMKDSGVESIGYYPANWQLLRAKYVFESFSKGQGITKEQVVKGGDIDCVRYGEIYSKYDICISKCFSQTQLKLIPSQQFASYGDILFAGTGELIEEIGKNVVYLGDKKILVGGDIIIGKHRQDPRFLNYAMYCTASQAQKSKGKSKLKVVHISSEEISNILVVVPPIDEQKKIADYLDFKCSFINELVEGHQSKIEKLVRYRQSLIYEYVTGKREVK